MYREVHKKGVNLTPFFVSFEKYGYFLSVISIFSFSISFSTDISPSFPLFLLSTVTVFDSIYLSPITKK